MNWRTLFRSHGGRALKALGLFAVTVLLAVASSLFIATQQSGRVAGFLGQVP
jgi:hypothetical protein